MNTVFTHTGSDPERFLSAGYMTWVTTSSFNKPQSCRDRVLKSDLSPELWKFQTHPSLGVFTARTVSIWTWTNKADSVFEGFSINKSNPLDRFPLEEPITLNSSRRQKIIQNILSQLEQLLLGGTRVTQAQRERGEQQRRVLYRKLFNFKTSSRRRDVYLPPTLHEAGETTWLFLHESCQLILQRAHDSIKRSVVHTEVNWLSGRGPDQLTDRSVGSEAE